MNVLERLTSIADGIQEIYPAAKITIAVSLPLSDIEELCANDESLGGVALQAIKTEGASMIVSIRGTVFAIEEKKVDPQMN